MKSLVNGCAAAALLMGLAFQAHAEIAVRDAPIHTIPADADDAPDDVSAVNSEAPPPAVQPPAIQVASAAPSEEKAEPAVVKALIQAKAPTLTPDENAFFDVLGQRVTDAASAYESYVRRAGAIDPAFSGAGSVQRAVKASAGYRPVQLEEGAIAYAALIALRNQAFVDGVRAIQNPAFADELTVHPERVLEVRGAADAAADAAGVLAAQGAILTAEGKAITKAAYDIQAQAWSKSPVADPKGVLQNAKDSAGETRVATVPSKEKLLASLVSAPQVPAPGSAPSPDVTRGLALAALAILGKTGDGVEARYEALLHDPSSEDCLKLAKLNLNQCLAVAGPNYEDVYCAGRHAVSDTGKCITAAAGAGSADVAPPPRLQQADLIGPEQADAYGKTASAPRDADDDDDDVARPAPATVAVAAPAPAPIRAPVAASVPVAAAPLAPPVAPPVAVAAAPIPLPVPAPAPAPRQYAEAPQAELQPAPQAAPQYAPPQYAPPQYAASQYAAPQPYAAQQYAPPQRAEPMPDPRQPRQAPAQAYAPQPQSYSYAQNDYAPQPPVPQAPQAQYGRSYAQPSYPQQQQYQPQPYQQQQPQYAPQPYQQPYAAQQSYPQQQPYYPPPQPGYPSYSGGSYYGR